ncbi:hypothetical protein R1flu_007866 [Riccia fluitans]|uniref:Uncharacterized protein n=1 Tax=Riccia fluitans TaxID=41844 RepID=A0ABD1Z349_9MARC
MRAEGGNDSRDAELAFREKGNFSDSELESIRVDNGSERDRVKRPSCSLRRFYEITNNPPTYDVSGSLGGNHFFTYTQGVISSVIERNSSTYHCETGGWKV